jgi:hypothetical protein
LQYVNNKCFISFRKDAFTVEMTVLSLRITFGFKVLVVGPVSFLSDFNVSTSSTLLSRLVFQAFDINNSCNDLISIKPLNLILTKRPLSLVLKINGASKLEYKVNITAKNEQMMVDGASESQKKLISQITFKASDFAVEKSPQQGIQASMPSVRLDSTNEFLASDNGDVIVHAPQIEPSKVRPHAYHVYQDIELKTPFPLWGFFKADKLEFPDAWADFSNDYEHYQSTLTKPLYQEHIKVFEAIKSKDFSKIFLYLLSVIKNTI